MKFTMTNNSANPDTVSFVPTGPAANDFHGILESNCPQPDNSGNVTLPGSSSCTVDSYFNPGALGTRNSTLNLSDTPGNSGATVGLTGTGGIGYYQVDNAGTVAYAGDAGFFGDTSQVNLNKPIVGITPTGDDGGYWLVATDGGIFNYGDAQFHGSAGALPLNKPIVGMATTSDAGGYWMVASDGGIFDYGDAGFFGSRGGQPLNKPIVGMAATPDGLGYWLVASDGGIFTYGDAQFHGSAGSLPLNKPIVGMAVTPDGGGYWLVASDGGIFGYGDAPFYGSTGAIHLNQPIVAMAPDARRPRLLVHGGRRGPVQLRHRPLPGQRHGPRPRPGGRHGGRRRPDGPGIERPAGPPARPRTRRDGCSRQARHRAAGSPAPDPTRPPYRSTILSSSTSTVTVAPSRYPPSSSASASESSISCCSTRRNGRAP